MQRMIVLKMTITQENMHEMNSKKSVEEIKKRTIGSNQIDLISYKYKIHSYFEIHLIHSERVL